MSAGADSTRSLEEMSPPPRRRATRASTASKTKKSAVCR